MANTYYRADDTGSIIFSRDNFEYLIKRINKLKEENKKLKEKNKKLLGKLDYYMDMCDMFWEDDVR